MHRRQLLLGAAGSAVLAAHPSTVAQPATSYPIKPVKVLVGVSAGGAADYMARIFTQKLSESMGQSFIVDNKPGAGGTLAADVVARSPADGYTLLVSAPTVMIVAPYLYKHLSFSPARDFIPISLLGGGPVVLVAHASVPARTVPELIELAKREPDKIAFGSGGKGTNSHLTGELFSSMAGVKLLHVPYKGDGQAVTDLMGGQVQIMFTGYNLVEPHVKSGLLKVLGVTSTSRIAALPDIPTVAEYGLKDFQAMGWLGVYAPKGTPAHVVQRLNAEWQKARMQPDVVNKFRTLGMDMLSTKTPEEFVAFQRTDAVRWAKVINDAGVKPD